MCIQLILKNLTQIRSFLSLILDIPLKKINRIIINWPRHKWQSAIWLAYCSLNGIRYGFCTFQTGFRRNDFIFVISYLSFWLWSVNFYQLIISFGWIKSAAFLQPNILFNRHTCSIRVYTKWTAICGFTCSSSLELTRMRKTGRHNYSVTSNFVYSKYLWEYRI